MIKQKIHRVAKTQIKFDKFKTLRVGTNAEYPPFEFIDENRNITGFDMELARELATRVGVELDILNMSFDGLIPALKSGKIDVAISAMSATEKRKKVVAFIHAII